MEAVLKIGEEEMTNRDIINYLKFHNEFDELVDRIVGDKLTAQAAVKRKMEPTLGELQERANDFRRLLGLHRAKDTHDWFAELNVTDDDFEDFIKEMILKKKMMAELTSEEQTRAYFAQHSPTFDAVDFKHIVVEGEGKAREISALVKDDPELFDELVLEHSLDDDTRFNQGKMLQVRRGMVDADLEAKIFNAKAGDILEPIRLGDEDIFELVEVLQFYPAQLTDEVKAEVAQTIYREWLAERSQEASIVVK